MEMLLTSALYTKWYKGRVTEACTSSGKPPCINLQEGVGLFGLLLILKCCYFSEGVMLEFRDSFLMATIL